MVRTKVGILLVVLSGLMFAEEVKSDSGALNLLHSLKRQKLFYSSTSENWIPPTIPNETGVCLGCCLIPTFGCIPVGQQVFGKQDTIKQDTIKSTTKKWDIEIGYSGGVCWAGEDLAKPFEGSPIAGFAQLPEYLEAHLYWLNSVYAGTIFNRNNSAWSLGVGIEYSWQRLVDRRGWWKYVYNAFDTTDGSLATLHSIELQKFSLQFEHNSNSFLSSGIEIIYSEILSEEMLFKMTPGDSIFSYKWVPSDSAAVSRRCAGAGFFIKLNIKKKIGTKITLLPFVSMKLSLAKEINNNSPWKRWWNDQLYLNFSGMNAGLKLNFGGVK